MGLATFCAEFSRMKLKILVSVNLLSGEILQQTIRKSNTSVQTFPNGVFFAKK
jgi:hypothetical protein